MKSVYSSLNPTPVHGSDQQHHGWVPQEHDYDPEWDYTVRYDQLDHPLVQAAQARLEALAQLDDTPMDPATPGRVFPVDLSAYDGVATYCNGTYNEPCILIDVDGHEGHEDQINKSIDHEVRHAIQESNWNGDENEPWADEDDAEGWEPPL